MNGDLQEGQVLRDRFVLHRCLRADSASSLWSARDLRLETPLLLRVYVRADVSGSGVPESVKRDARRYRGLQHPHLARIHDLHEGDEVHLVSIDAPEGELLSTVLTRTGPQEYRHLVTAARPLVEALLHLHERGAHHGRVDPDHVLVDGETRWVLLPGDETKPTGSDLRQLGQLMAAVLTGGRVPERGRQLNDVPDRLHEGRTVPALLNQLVNDLDTEDTAVRPAGMREVLSRLDQIERFLELGPQGRSEPEPAPRPEEPRVMPPPAPVRTARGRRLKWIAVPAVMAGGAILIYPAVRDRAHPPPVEEVEIASPSAAPISAAPATPAANEDQAKLAREKLAAEEALNHYLALRRQLDEIGTPTWGGEPYRAATSTADEADQSFVEGQYATAARQYQEATTALQRVADSKDEALERLLREGRAALELPDSEKATTAFQLALLIEPGHEQARIGRQRAATLDEVNRLLASGQTHENESRLSFALVDYASAAELDPHCDEAGAAYRRIKEALAEEEFRALMSRGLDAYHRGDYAEARALLAEARRFRPDAREVGRAQAMVEEAERLEEMKRLKQQALAHEGQEQWQEAWAVYQQVLALDPSLQFAKDGKSRSEERIRLEKQTRHYLTHRELLIERGTREDALRLVQTLEALADKGPRLRQAYAELAEQVRRANIPHRVTLQSDELTEVAVYRVGRYGTFESIELELIPGVYTVVGRRPGYQDVRLTLRLNPGDEGTTLTVICKDRIP